MLEFDSIGDYVKAGPRRLADAKELLEQPTLEPDAPDAAHRHLRGAVYLAGYAVECALKAYIISRAPPAQRFLEAIERRRQEGEPDLRLLGRSRAQSGCPAEGYRPGGTDGPTPATQEAVRPVPEVAAILALRLVALHFPR